jgi:hypothetical protein
VEADLTAHGFDELRGVVADAVLEDDLNLFEVFDIGRGSPSSTTMLATLPRASVSILSSSPRNSARSKFIVGNVAVAAIEGATARSGNLESSEIVETDDIEFGGGLGICAALAAFNHILIVDRG